jgi:hypothetical protein
MGTPIDISNLTVAERKALYDRLAFDLAQSGRKEPPPEAEGDLWSLLSDLLRVRMPMSQFLASYGKAKFSDASALMQQYIEEGCAVSVRREARVGMMRICLECVISHLKARSIPTSPSSVLNSFGMLESCVNRSFPGYYEARLLHRLAPLQQMAG